MEAQKSRVVNLYGVEHLQPIQNGLIKLVDLIGNKIIL